MNGVIVIVYVRPSPLPALGAQPQLDDPGHIIARSLLTTIAASLIVLALLSEALA